MSQTEDKGKLFVGGLSWETTQSSLQAYFSRYGEVTDCVVVMNPTTGKSRGFGFVHFKDPSCVETVLAAGPHTLDGKQIDPNGCNRKKLNKTSGKENSRRKLFVGGLPPSADEQMLRDGFSKYGKVNEVVIVYDQQKQKPRGFGFLTFEDEATVERIVQERFIQIAGKQVECKRAEPKDSTSSLSSAAAGPMLLAQAPDGSMSLIPAHALASPLTGAASIGHPAAAMGLLSHGTDLAAAYGQGVGATELLQSQVLPSAAAAAPGLRYLSPGLGGSVGSPQYVMMGTGASPGAGSQLVMVQGPGGLQLMQRPTAGSILMQQPAAAAAVGGGGYMLTGGLPSATPAMSQYVLGYPTAGTAAVSTASDLSAAAAAAAAAYKMPMSLAHFGMYGQMNGGLVGPSADVTADKSSSQTAAQLAASYGIIGGEAGDDAALRQSSVVDCQQQALPTVAPGGSVNPAAAAGLGYYIIPNLQSSLAVGGGLAAAAGTMSTAGRLAHAYHPYRR